MQVWNDDNMELVPNLPENPAEKSRYHRIVDFLSKTLRNTNTYLFGDITLGSDAENETFLHKVDDEPSTAESPSFKKDI